MVGFLHLVQVKKICIDRQFFLPTDILNINEIFISNNFGNLQQAPY